jgi:hypothetical protein
MTAEYERFLGRAAQGDPVIASGIVVMLDGKACELLSEPLARFEPGISEGDALGSIVVCGESTEILQ